MKTVIVICPLLRPFVDGLSENEDIAITVALDGHNLVVFGNSDTTGTGPVQVVLLNHDELSTDIDQPLRWKINGDQHTEKLADFIAARLAAIEDEVRAHAASHDLDDDLVALNSGKFNTEGFVA